MKSLKPLIKWSGGKYDELKIIKQYLPIKYSLYIEPFIGSGALFFDLQPPKSIICDTHIELIDFYNEIKNGNINKIYDFMETNKNDEDTYYNIRDNLKIENSIINASRFYYLRKTCYRGMLRYNKSGKFNIPFGKYKTCNYDILLDSSYEELLKKSIIICGDYKTIFNEYNSEDNFIFLDPPYDSIFKNYGYNDFTEKDHIELSQFFKTTKNKCMLVIGKTDFIVSLYKDYIKYEYTKNYKFKIHSGRINNLNNKHLIICNY
jgi:DNA adenine methylase